MKRQPIVAGNWKMNGTQAQARTLTQAVLKVLSKETEVEVILCPPFTALATVAQFLKGTSIGLGAQNLYWEPYGAFTGEISPEMLKELGCRYCIVGHSERRQLLKETDADIQKKVHAAHAAQLAVILCVGETLKEREAGKTWGVIEAQLKTDLDRVEGDRLSSRLVIAYEPIWAIGTGKNATAAQAQEVHAQIRSWLASRFGNEPAQAIRIQYGGSVKPANAAQLLSQADVDGGLIGGASLEAASFIAIVDAAKSVGVY